MFRGYCLFDSILLFLFWLNSIFAKIDPIKEVYQEVAIIYLQLKLIVENKRNKSIVLYYQISNFVFLLREICLVLATFSALGKCRNKTVVV